ncbi:BQ5605_C003g02304 [Microbotryum silenes-dioicae]|uniref:BQ5605_C003g02304 protein n=1 Tax=Microbotryum silenes-dioicae TaxID=796604 RepID=A0A2X0M4S7_9BASI|nr:BQ5605_C003g02304 [Microbotryum silenes-dioicae]
MDIDEPRASTSSPPLPAGEPIDVDEQDAVTTTATGNGDAEEEQGGDQSGDDNNEEGTADKRDEQEPSETASVYTVVTGVADTLTLVQFGDDDDSELSALSSDEDDDDDANKSDKTRRIQDSDGEDGDGPSLPHLPEGSDDAHRDQDSDQDDDDEDDGGDEYEEPDLNRIKFKKKKKSASTDDGGELPELRRKKKKKPKRDEPEVPEPIEEEIDPEKARRKALDDRLKEIIKPTKARTGGKKRKDADDDDLEAFNDEKVAELRTAMLRAADADITENEAGRYAPNKLRMLPRVVEMMQKTSLGESIVENGVLESVRRWLEPLPDKSLPAINIQRAMFESLRTLPIETSALKSSGLGKIVYFYTKCKRVEPTIGRMANQLVSDWMRPIIRRSKAFVDKDPYAEPLTNPNANHSNRRIRVPAGVVGTTNKAADDDAGLARRHARIPESFSASFSVAPPTSARDRHGAGGGLQSGHSVTAVSTKMKGYKKKLVAGQQASRRV